MPKRKIRGGARSIGGINPVARSNVMARPAVPTPTSTWEKIKNFAKQHKIVSRGLKAVSGMVGDKYAPLFNAGSSLAESYGYGRKKKHGRGWGDDDPNAPYMKIGKKIKFPSMKGSGKVVRF